MRNFTKFIYRSNALKTISWLTILLIISVFSLEAQNKITAPGKISGRIIDSISGQPLDYATISLFAQKENKLINGTTTDNKGAFKLTDIPEGTYKISVYFIGYKRLEKRNILIGKANPVIVLDVIKLSGTETTLNGVTITGSKNIIENKIDRMVYNADKDITSQSGVAADVLKKVPQVSVDVDGNVELQGNSSIRFLINGKPSALFGSNIADVLQSIPASQIQSIDIITSPGAKYDAEGTGGIINIILKKNNAHGISGNVSLSGGTRLENGAFNLNARKVNFGANAFFSGNAQLLSSTINNLDRLSQDTLTSSQLLQSSTSNFKRNGFQSGIGFDWDITPKDNFSGTLGYNYFGNSNAGNADRQTLMKDASGNPISDTWDAINSSSNFHEYAFEWNLAYKKKFKKEDQELEILYNSSNGNINSNYDQSQKHVSSSAIFNSSYGKNPGIENETNIEINYTQPINEDARFEAGAKTELDHIKSNSNVFLLNTSTEKFDYNNEQSSSVDYHRIVNAGYISATFRLFNLLDFKPGFRDEYTTAKSVFSNSGNVTMKPYNTIVPSMVISHTFKNNEMLKISYSHRIERPDYRDLNPFINASDPKNISMGNAELRPEIGDKLELSYSQTFKKGANVNVTLFYRGNRDDIQSYTNYYSSYKIGDSTYSNVAVSTRENIGSEDNYGLNLFASVPITQKLNLRTNISCFQRFITTGLPSGGDKHGFNYRTNINATYQLSGTLIIEILGNFNSARINAQGTMPSFTTYNFAFRKQLFNKKGSIALTATNFLNKYVNQKTELSGQNFTIINNRQLPYRSFGFNFTFKFGHMEFKQEKEFEDMNLKDPQQ